MRLQLQSGIVDVSHRYEEDVCDKTTVLHSDDITASRLDITKVQAGTGTIKAQNVDITHFEENRRISKCFENYDLASRKFQEAIR